MMTAEVVFAVLGKNMTWSDLFSEAAVELQGLTSETGGPGPAASPCLCLGRNSSGPPHLHRGSHHYLGQTDNRIPTGTPRLSALVLAGSHKSSQLRQDK